eukprot:TRINITY_DN579_c0_g1_i1.p1 TRINITY_DN579_c0_g1~~TRINITY_DN579_c0_g1_i1.p1  ORF type:complete len:345 (-),score=90.13 TRINITY_DN579_c0_g1_i1:55-1089(-)
MNRTGAVGITLLAPIITAVTSLYQGNALFDPTVRLMKSVITPMVGLEIEFSKVEGSIKTGELNFQDLRLRRKGEGFEIDLKADRLYVTSGCNLLHAREHLKGDGLVVDLISVSGGQANIVVKKKGNSPPPHIIFKQIKVVDSTLDCTAQGLTLPSIKIDELYTQNINTQEASKIVDRIAFGSQVRGAIGSGSIQGINTITTSGPQTVWKGRDVPVGFVADVLNHFFKPPFDLRGDASMDFKFQVVPSPVQDMNRRVIVDLQLKDIALGKALDGLTSISTSLVDSSIGDRPIHMEWDTQGDRIEPIIQEFTTEFLKSAMERGKKNLQSKVQKGVKRFEEWWNKDD